MNNSFKEKRNALINEFAGNNLGFQSGRKIVNFLMMAIIILRIIHASFVIIHSGINNNYLGPFGIFIQIISILISILFALMISNAGVKGLVYLALIGGIYSLFSALQNNAFYGFGKDDALFNISTIFFIILVLFQIVGMLILLLNTKCKVFFVVMSNVGREFQKSFKTGL